MSKTLLLFVCAGLAVISTLYILPPNNHHLASSASTQPQRRRLTTSSYGLQGWKFFQRVNDPETITIKDIINIEAKLAPPPLEALHVCGRPAPIPYEIDMQVMQKFDRCRLLAQPPQKTKLLLMEGIQTYGRTGNNLIEFLHGLQFAADHGMIVGIMQGSWPTHLITNMWMAIQDSMDEWREFVELSFCVKILDTYEEVDQYEKVYKRDTRSLFVYQHHGLINQYVEYQSYIIRTLFRYYNKGVGVTMRHKPVGDMCSVLDAIFGSEKESAVYSVIHSRSLEGDPGIRLLARIATNSGCDPMAALDMEPEYVKAILAPLGMLNRPILVITDHQRPEILKKLRADPEIGPNIRLLPQQATWVGGDITLALMANVFIGNPASSFSGFIAKSRVALGFETNYLFRKKNEDGEWVDVCDHRCIFDWKVMNAMA